MIGSVPPVVGLAKSSEPTNSSPINIIRESNAIPRPSDNVPRELYDYFNIDYGTSNSLDHKQMKEIYKYLRSENSTMADVYSKLTDISVKLGEPRITETRHGRIWNYLKLGEQIFELQQRQEMLRNKNVG